MRATVFFSWQSDTPSKSGREYLYAALAEAIASIPEDPQLVLRPELDHDTHGVPGAPLVVSAILQKIDECSVFVADVSLTYERRRPAAERHAPNPNVLLELGYALKRLGHARVLLLLNVEFGSPEELPFDLRGNRVIPYQHYQKADQDQLVRELGEAIHLILTSAGPPADVLPRAEILLKYVKRHIANDRHQYRLPVRVRNTGDEVLAGWSVEVEFPRALLEPSLSYPIARELDGRRVVVMRRTQEEHSGPLYPGDEKELIGIDYYMDDDLYDRRGQLFSMPVTARFYVGTKLVARGTTTVGELQEY